MTTNKGGKTYVGIFPLSSPLPYIIIIIIIGYISSMKYIILKNKNNSKKKYNMKKNFRL